MLEGGRRPARGSRISGALLVRLRNPDQVGIYAGTRVDEEEPARDTGSIIDDRAEGPELFGPLENRLGREIRGSRESLASPVLVLKHGEKIGAAVLGLHVPGDQRILAHWLPSLPAHQGLLVGQRSSWVVNIAAPVSVIGARAPAWCRRSVSSRASHRAMTFEEDNASGVGRALRGVKDRLAQRGGSI